MKNKVIILLIFTQVIIVGYLGFTIYQKRQPNILGQVTYSPLNKDALVYNPESELKYFYEPSENLVEDPHESWGISKANYNINSDLLHDRFDYSVEKPENTFRIITLGDSFTYGAYLDTHLNFTEQLEDLLNKENDCKNFEVINLGVAGYDIQYSVERFMLRGQKYDPDLIVWLIKSDDFYAPNELIMEKQIYYTEMIDPEVIRDIAATGNMLNVQLAINDLRSKYESEEILGYERSNLDRLISQYNGNIVAAGWNVMFQSYKNVLSDEDDANSNFFYFDLPFLDFEDERYLLPDSHPNAAGHKRLADEIFEYLRKNDLIPCY